MTTTKINAEQANTEQGNTEEISTQQPPDLRYRLKRMRVDHSFHATASLLAKALKFRESAKLAHKNNRKIMEDPAAREIAHELVRHAKHWYLIWNEYRTGLNVPPDQEEIEETAKTRNGEVVQAAKRLGWTLQREENAGEPAKKLLRAALRLKSDPKSNRQHLDNTTDPTAPQKGAGSGQDDQNSIPTATHNQTAQAAKIPEAQR